MSRSRPPILEDLRPDRRRRDWRWKFLEVLAASASVSTACVAAGVARDTAYRHREKFPRFRAKWDEALDIALEVLEVEMRRRALGGPDDRASHLLLMFALKAHKPEKYRDLYRPPPTDPADEADESIDPATAAAALRAAAQESLRSRESDESESQ